MVRNVLLLNIIIVSAIFFMLPMPLAAAISRVIQENGSSYIVDLHGERWDVTQAKSIGFVPEKFQHETSATISAVGDLMCARNLENSGCHYHSL